jgi:hypothetical protein
MPGVRDMRVRRSWADVELSGCPSEIPPPPRERLPGLWFRLRRSRVRRAARPADEDVGVRRAASSCSAPNCPNIAVHRGRCLEHAPKPWAGSEQSRNRRGVLRGHALQKVRARRIRAAGGRCQRCGRSGVALVLHHFGELTDYGSTLVLCERCHRREHRTVSSYEPGHPLRRLGKRDHDLVSDYRTAITPECAQREDARAGDGAGLRGPRGEAARRGRPDRSLRFRRSAGPAQRRRALASELRPHPAPPTRPRRQPPTQRRLLPDRDHAGARPSSRPRLPRAKTGGRQEPP